MEVALQRALQITVITVIMQDHTIGKSSLQLSQST